MGWNFFFSKRYLRTILLFPPRCDPFFSPVILPKGIGSRMVTHRIGQAKAEVTERKLAGWKSIAGHLECDERTAKRWERERGLPVHRLPGGKRCVVTALTSELDDWQRPRELEENAQLWRRQLGRPLVWAAIGAAVLLVAVAAPWALKGRNVLRASLSRAPASSAAIRRVPTPGAEELYFQGRYFWNLRTADGLAKALDVYTQAIVKDPSYAQAYAGLAETYDLLPQFAGANLEESLSKAKDAAGRAEALDPNLAAAHRAKAFAMFFGDWDIGGSDAEFRRALALDPSSAQTHQWYASTLDDRLEAAECLRQIDDALRLNPLSAAIAADAALFHANFGDFNAGMRDLKEIERTQPTLASPSYFLREIDFAIGDFPAYIVEARRFASITHSPDDMALADAVARGWAQGGKTGLLKARAEVLKAAFDRGAEQGFQLGVTLLLLGYPDQALPYFKASLNRRYLLLITMQQCPWAKALSRDPGYEDLFAQIRGRLRNGYPARPPVFPVKLRLPM